MTLQEILDKAIALDASDAFLVAGLPVTYKRGGHQERMQDTVMKPTPSFDG